MAGGKLDYGQSEHGNFKVVDTIEVPHPFIITSRHVAYAADRNSGMLTKSAIKHSGVPCGMRGCLLSIDEHETALLVSCLAPLKDTDDEKKANPELHKYLLDVKEQCEAEKYAGFTFVDSTEKGVHPKKEGDD